MSGSAVGKIKASRVNNLDAAEYVGPVGQMWYDVDTGILRLGDDVTPGGTIVGGGGGNGSPGAPNRSIQFNSGGTFGGSSGLTTDGANVTATGNIRAAYFLGDGSQLTNLPTGDYSNSNVAAYLPTFTGNLTAGNILTNNYLYANGQPFTPGTNYSNANVSSFLPTYTGNLAGGNVSVTGNVRGAFIIGDGSQLTNLPSGNYSNANVAAYLPTYTGNLTAGNAVISGNLQVLGTTVSVNTTTLTVDNVAITVGDTTTVPSALNNAGILVGNNQSGNTAVASWLYNFSSNSWTTLLNITSPTINAITTSTTGLNSAIVSLTGQVYSNSNVQSYLPTYSGLLTNLANVFSIGNIATGTFFIGNGSQLTGLNANNLSGTTLSANVLTSSLTTVGTLGNLSVTSNVNAGNLRTAGSITATGNVTGAFFIGDGSQLTNLPAGNYSNANVADYLPTYTGNLAGSNISATGNILTNGLISSTGNIRGGNLVSGGSIGASGAISTSGAVFATTMSALSTITALNFNAVSGGNISGGNISISGNAVLGRMLGSNVSVSGNATASFFIGDGSQLTNLPAGNYSNANVAAFLPTNTSNVSANYFIGDGSQLTNLPAGNYSNANVAAYLPNYAGNLGNISTSGYIFGNGAFLTGITGGTGNYSNANVANYLPTYSGAFTAATVTTTGNISGNYILGNGSQLTGMYSNVNVQAFLPIYSGNLGYIQNMTVTGAISVAGNIASGSFFVGNGSQLTGMYSNATVASYLPTYTGNIAAGNISVTGIMYGNGSGLTSITGGNVYGYVPNATYASGAGTAAQANIANTANSATTAATVTTNAQPNITSVGTLSTLSVTGNISASYYNGNGSQLTGLPSQRACVTSNITSLTAGYAINISADYGNAEYPAGVFTIYQTAAPIPTITLTNQWTGTGSTSKNAYANYAGNVVNLSNVNMTLGISSGTFSVQSSDNIIIGNTVITGSNLTGIGITGTGGTYSIPFSLIGNAVQVTSNIPVSVNLTTSAGGPINAVGNTLTTIEPQPFSLTGITASFANTTYLIGANSSQPVSFTTTVGTGTAISGNIIISGAANVTTNVGTTLTGNTSSITSTAGNFVVTASYLGSGLYGAGNSVATANVSLTGAAYSTPMFIKSTSDDSNPNFTTSDTNFGASWQPGPGAPGNTYGFLTNQFNPTSQFYWMAIPDADFWSYGNDNPAFPGTPNLYYNYVLTGIGVVNSSINAAYGNGTDTFGGSGGTVTIGNIPYVAIGFTGFANVEAPSNPANLFVWASTSSTS